MATQKEATMIVADHTNNDFFMVTNRRLYWHRGVMAILQILRDMAKNPPEPPIIDDQYADEESISDLSGSSFFRNFWKTEGAEALEDEAPALDW